MSWPADGGSAVLISRRRIRCISPGQKTASLTYMYVSVSRRRACCPGQQTAGLLGLGQQTAGLLCPPADGGSTLSWSADGGPHQQTAGRCVLVSGQQACCNVAASRRGRPLALTIKSQVHGERGGCAALCTKVDSSRVPMYRRLSFRTWSTAGRPTGPAQYQVQSIIIGTRAKSTAQKQRDAQTAAVTTATPPIRIRLEAT